MKDSTELCSICDNNIKNPRIDRHYLIQQLSAVLSFEKGFLFTLKQMLLFPGHSTRQFINGDRQRYMKPVVFLILCSFIYTLFNQWLAFEGEMAHDLEIKEGSQLEFLRWIQGHYGYLNILTSIISAFWIKLFFSKFSYNLFEIIVLVCFYSGISMLIMAFFGVLQTLTGWRTYWESWLVTFVFSIYAISQFYNSRKISAYLRSAIACIIGYFSFMMLIVIVMVLIIILKI